MTSLRLLLTGATGYIGGSILTTLLNSDKPTVKSLQISALVRSEEQAKRLTEIGVTPILFTDLDDVEVIQKAASEHDVVINTANGFHQASAVALINGLGERKAKIGKDVYFIHQSGTSNLADTPITKAFTEPIREFSDKDDIYSYERRREDAVAYAQRTTELAAIETGLEKDVKTYVIMSPLIYGTGSGAFNKASIQIPSLMKTALAEGQSIVIGDGAGVWDYVHIADLVVLFEILLDKAISGEDIPSEKQGIYFSGTGRFSWRELAELVGKAGVEIGALESADPKEVTLEFISQKSGLPVQLLELGFASNSKTNADFAKELGWQPQKTARDWEDSFVGEFKAVQQKSRLDG